MSYTDAFNQRYYTSASLRLTIKSVSKQRGTTCMLMTLRYFHFHYNIPETRQRKRSLLRVHHRLPESCIPHPAAVFDPIPLCIGWPFSRFASKCVGLPLSVFFLFSDFRFLDIFRQKLGLLNFQTTDEMLIQSFLWVCMQPFFFLFLLKLGQKSMTSEFIVLYCTRELVRVAATKTSLRNRNLR